MFLALLLLGILVAALFWAALTTILEKAAGESVASSAIIMIIGTMSSTAIWVMLLLHFGVT